MRAEKTHKFKKLKRTGTGSLLLFIATLFAVVTANSPLSYDYHRLFDSNLIIKTYNSQWHLNLRTFINEGLMTLFFLFISLGIKREFKSGELDSSKKAILPFISALGGMAMPALIFLAINHSHPDLITGWAIPVATDIAFSLSILVILRKHIPSSLKVYLSALAIIDDLGAILVIAVFYTHKIQAVFFLFSIPPLLGLLLLNRYKIKKLAPYFFLGALLWIGVFYSHIHSVVAGVIVGLTIPLHTAGRNIDPPLIKLENALRPWVDFFILPLFAFANTGLVLSKIHLSLFYHPLTLGIVCGLFFGKQLGIFIPSWLAIKLKIAKLPRHANFYHLYGISLICSIGFTMSLFIGQLAFTESQPELMNLVKLGVIAASLLAAILGYLVLRSQSANDLLASRIKP